jgi:hypothetical protein
MGVVGCVLVIVVAVVTWGITRAKAYDERARCAQNLKRLVAALNTSIHSGEQSPMGFTSVLSAYNAIGNPFPFICPSDESRRGVTNFAALQAKGSSYEPGMHLVGGNSTHSLEHSANHIVLRCTIHLNVAMADGSVHMVTPRGLTNLLHLSRTE